MLLSRFKHLLGLISLLIISLGWTPSNPTKSVNNFCEIYGIIYFAENKTNADYIVFVEDQETFANVVVYMESSLSYADAPGHWVEGSQKHLSDAIIYVTDNISEADFTIAYTDIESFAGCND